MIYTAIYFLKGGEGDPEDNQDSEEEEEEEIMEEEDDDDSDYPEEMEDEDDASYCTESSFRSHSTYSSTPGRESVGELKQVEGTPHAPSRLANTVRTPMRGCEGCPQALPGRGVCK